MKHMLENGDMIKFHSITNHNVTHLMPTTYLKTVVESLHSKDELPNMPPSNAKLYKNYDIKSTLCVHDISPQLRLSKQATCKHIKQCKNMYIIYEWYMVKVNRISWVWGETEQVQPRRLSLCLSHYRCMYLFIVLPQGIQLSILILQLHLKFAIDFI